MKHFLILLVFFAGVSLSAVTLLSENFTSALPTGWTTSGSTNPHFYYSNTSGAGGSAGEVKFFYNPSETGTFRLITTAFSTLRVHDMSLSFKQFVDWYAADFNLSVQISDDLLNWDTVWSITPTEDTSSHTVNASIPWNLGNSATTYLAFVFTGNTFNINYWYIDDVLLTYSNSLGIGTWPVADYNLAGNLIIPNTYTLNLQPGTRLFMADNANVDVNGCLRAIGTGPNKIVFSSQSGANTWYGIEIENVAAANDSTILEWCEIKKSMDGAVEILNTDKVRIQSCQISSNTTTVRGGGIYGSGSDAVIKSCFFNNNSALQGGAALDFYNSSPVIFSNRILQNYISGAGGIGTMSLRYCNINGVSHNSLYNNGSTSGMTTVHLAACSGAFRYNLLVNNAFYGIYVTGNVSPLQIDHCTIAYNDNSAINTDAPVSVSNSIMFSNGSIEFVNNSGVPDIAFIRFCDVWGGTYSITGVNPANIQNIISADPLFKDPPDGTGSDYYAYDANFTLSDLSPCIDAGDYLSGEYDADFSAPDLGRYSRLLKPAIYSAADLAPDQGHQIDLRWYPNDKDVSWDPAAWYHVFRMTDGRAAVGAVFVTDPREITPDLISSNSKICWVHNERILTYLGQVKAMNREAYSLIVPTIQDSSSTGLHQEVFVVTYFDNVYFWDSVGLAGYSVDNIPPLAPRNALLSRSSPNSLRLDWEEVTEGIWEGNSYPEINNISYKVYASDDPDFQPGPANFLMVSTHPNAVFNDLSAPRRFFKIIASDSE